MAFWDMIATGLQYLSALFIFTVGVAALMVVVFFVIDRLQIRDAIRRNYPVLGRFRVLFTQLGEFFRQYFFAMDREEMPFNRAQRKWIHRTGKPCRTEPDQFNLNHGYAGGGVQAARGLSELKSVLLENVPKRLCLFTRSPLERLGDIPGGR